MDLAFRWPRTLRIVGTLCVIAGVLDPLEGSVVILMGGALLAVGAFLAKSRQRGLLVVALAMLVIGIGAMFWMSALGGIGGNTGRSMAWSVLLAPYAIGWALALVGAYRWFKEGPGGSAEAEART